MYEISLAKDKPDIEYMFKRAKELMDIGIRINDIDKLYKEFEENQLKLGELIKERYGIKNPNSSQQIISYMKSLNSPEVYEVCFINGKWTSNKDAMVELAYKGYEFASDLLDYRKVKKYVESIRAMKDSVDDRGFVHPKVSLGKTNRINYKDPALMNLPKELLWYIVSPRIEGNVLYSVDIKNQEPSILINLLGIEELKGALKSDKGLYEELFKKPFTQYTKLYIHVKEGVDKKILSMKELSKNEEIPPVYYTPIKTTVDSVYYNNERVKLIGVCNTLTCIGEMPIIPDKVVIETESGNIYEVEVEWDEISKRKLNKEGITEVKGRLLGLDIACDGIKRKEFKQAWNAMAYGVSIYGIKRICKHIDGELIYKYFNSIPRFREYKKRCREFAKNGMQYINTAFRTRLYANEKDPNRLERVLMDLPIQGTGADILSLLIKHFDEEVEKRGLEGKLSLYYTRHDELIIEVDGKWLEEVGDSEVEGILRDILEHRIDNWEPFKVEIERIKVGNVEDLYSNDENIFE